MSLLTPEVYDEFNARGERLKQGLQKAINNSGLKAFVYGQGAMNNIVLFNEVPQNYRHFLSMCKPPFLERAMRLQELLADEGVLTMRGMFVSSTPMTDDDVEFTVAAAERAFTKMVEEEGA